MKTIEAQAKYGITKAQLAGGELWDVLLSKEVWIALLGVLVALAKWQGWDIPMEIFVAIEVLIVALITALSKR